MRFWLPIIILIFIPFYSVGADESNAGIVRGLWYEKEIFFVGEPIRMYVAVRNNTGADLTGAVEFFVNGERIERNFIDALDGRIVESRADWTPGYGTSTISATLSRTEISSTASGTKAVTLTSAIADDIIFIDYDTDKDRVGDREDNDDDGDGISDEEEKAAGTDPLVYNESKAITVKDDEEAGSADTKGSSGENKSEEPEGLEKFLTDNRAGSTLSSVTNFINTSKNKLDEYRESRIEARVQTESEAGSGGEADAPATTSPKSEGADGVIDENGPATTSHIGEITRSTDNASDNLVTLVKSIFVGIKAMTIFIYDAILFALSKFLAHPILVQLTLLLLILFLILKLAQRFSKRQY